MQDVLHAWSTTDAALRTSFVDRVLREVSAGPAASRDQMTGLNVTTQARPSTPHRTVGISGCVSRIFVSSAPEPSPHRVGSRPPRWRVKHLIYNDLRLHHHRLQHTVGAPLLAPGGAGTDPIPHLGPGCQGPVDSKRFLHPEANTRAGRAEAPRDSSRLARCEAAGRREESGRRGSGQLPATPDTMWMRRR
jgi:hypothetical protein